MYYFPRHKLGYFHIPKTGGTSMFNFLIKEMRARGDEEQEITLDLYHEPIANKVRVLGAEVFSSGTFLTSIRNPYAVVVSLYFWYQRKAKEGHPDLDIYPETLKVAAMDFEEYLSWYMGNERSFEDYLLLDGSIPANLRVLKLESIDAEVDRILNGELGLGIHGQIPRMRRSAHGPFMSYLNDDAIRRINRMYQWVFERYYPAERVDLR